MKKFPVGSLVRNHNDTVVLVSVDYAGNPERFAGVVISTNDNKTFVGEYSTNWQQDEFNLMDSHLEIFEN